MGKVITVSVIWLVCRVLISVCYCCSIHLYLYISIYIELYISPLYIDCFIKKLRQRSSELQVKMPYIVALSLEEQLVGGSSDGTTGGGNYSSGIPVEAHDE